MFFRRAVCQILTGLTLTASVCMAEDVSFFYTRGLNPLIPVYGAVQDGVQVNVPFVYVIAGQRVDVAVTFTVAGRMGTISKTIGMPDQLAAFQYITDSGAWSSHFMIGTWFYLCPRGQIDGVLIESISVSLQQDSVTSVKTVAQPAADHIY